jgi:hypothetical protein
MILQTPSDLGPTQHRKPLFPSCYRGFDPHHPLFPLIRGRAGLLSIFEHLRL